MNEANEERPALKLSSQQLATMAELTARGIPFTPPTVDSETAWAAFDALEDYDYDAVREGREADVRMQMEALAEEREAQA